MRTIKETAAETGLHEYFVRQLVKQGKIKYVKAGRKTLINLDLFIEFLNSGKGAGV
jgi:excisionase family DNA binding protein